MKSSKRWLRKSDKRNLHKNDRECRRFVLYKHVVQVIQGISKNLMLQGRLTQLIVAGPEKIEQKRETVLGNNHKGWMEKV